MGLPRPDMATVINCFGERFIDKHHPNAYQLSVLGALSSCRTPALGGHRYRCDHCGALHTTYNSCRNRHCPKCQGPAQAFWVEDRINNAYPVKHYHIVFTLPKVLNRICITDSRWFYNLLFASAWKTLRHFGYSHYAVEPGAVCILHTWGQNLSLHPHVHCIVPALGYSLRGKMKHIGKGGKYLYPVTQLSLKFRGVFMEGIKKQLIRKNTLSLQINTIDQAWKKKWVVFCQPALGNAARVIKYLGQYTHRVAISNERILAISSTHVRFSLKDYRDNSRVKTIELTGEEFLRRFSLHILPKSFVKIRHYGIYSTRFRSSVGHIKMMIKPAETVFDRINRLLNRDITRCPFCGKGRLVPIEIVPRIRSPGFVSMAMQKLINY